MVPKLGLLSAGIFVFAPTLRAVSRVLDTSQPFRHGCLRLCWRTLFACLQQLWPLRL
jgi:hypothetical protein